jgi:hypothetical protein
MRLVEVEDIVGGHDFNRADRAIRVQAFSRGERSSRVLKISGPWKGTASAVPIEPSRIRALAPEGSSQKFCRATVQPFSVRASARYGVNHPLAVIHSQEKHDA